MVPKSGRSERGRKRNFGVYQTTAPNNLLLKGYFYLEFSGRGRKSGSAYALVDLVTLAPLYISDYLNDEWYFMILPNLVYGNNIP